MGRRHFGYETLLARTRNNRVLQLKKEERHFLGQDALLGYITARDKGLSVTGWGIPTQQLLQRHSSSFSCV